MTSIMETTIGGNSGDDVMVPACWFRWTSARGQEVADVSMDIASPCSNDIVGAAACAATATSEHANAAMITMNMVAKNHEGCVMLGVRW